MPPRVGCWHLRSAQAKATRLFEPELNAFVLRILHSHTTRATFPRQQHPSVSLLNSFDGRTARQLLHCKHESRFIHGLAESLPRPMSRYLFWKETVTMNLKKWAGLCVLTT